MTNEQLAFLQLVKLGLWGERHLESAKELCKSGTLDWAHIMDIANEQTTIGIVTDALTRLPREMRPSKPLYFNAISQTSDIEVANGKMNELASLLMRKLKGQGVDTVLLKGQGVALCYPNPMHRQCGDIDLLVDDDGQYEKACQLMGLISPFSDVGESHSEFSIMGFCVELHGKYGFSICPKVTRNLRTWNDLRLNSFRQEKGLVLPSVQFDAIFIFAHMLNHFMTGGVGLRQITDWMMFVYAHVGEMDRKVLMDDLQLLGLRKFWKAFAALAVVLLGYPEEKMPFYDKRWDKKAVTLIDCIFKTGNFGALQKAEQLSNDTNKWVKKVHTAFGQLPVYGRVGRLFPRESIYCFFKYSKGVLKR